MNGRSRAEVLIADQITHFVFGYVFEVFYGRLYFVCFSLEVVNILGFVVVSELFGFVFVLSSDSVLVVFHLA